MNQEKFTPSQCFQESREHIVSSAIWSARFSYYGTKWLFTNYPNVVWPVILVAVVLSSLCTIGQARIERDEMSAECAILQDSLNRVTMAPVRYETLSGKVVNPLPPLRKQKEDE